MELRLFITTFLLMLVAFHVCAEDEKKEVEREVEKRMDPALLGKRMSDPSAFGKRLLDRGGKRQDTAWMGKRQDRGGKRQDMAWMGKRQDRGGKRQDTAWMGKRQDRGGKRQDMAWMGKRDDNRRGEEEELQKEMDAFFRRFGGGR